ncbi:MAG: hypothetical protein HY791_09970 [Deltaproteobacteria bacterium]|nr:hypothetical protein [Deltaproteobacteria bacterium]
MPVDQAVQSIDRTVYARRGGRLAFYEGEAWRQVELAQDSSVEVMTTDPSGGAVVILRKSQSWELWRFRRGDGRRIAASSLPVPAKPRLYVTTKGVVWLFGDSRRLIEVSARGRAQVHLLEPDWLVTPESPKLPRCSGLTAEGCCEATSSTGQVFCGSVRLFEANGAIWVWAKGASNAYVLPGLLRYAGGFEPWVSQGLPAGVTRAVLPLERRGSPPSALLSTDNRLFRLDLTTRTVAPEPFPPLVEQTPQNILALYRAQSSTWALVERSFQQDAGILFGRADGAAAFERVLPGVGGRVYQFMDDPVFASAPDRASREHVWLATPDGPVWHLSGSTKERLDWGRGVPVTSVTGIFLIDADTLMLTDSSAGTLLMPAWTSGAAPSSVVTRLPFMKRALTWTADRRVWWLEEKDPLSLHEWNGVRHDTHSPSPEFRDRIFASNSTLFADSKDLLWVVPSPSSGYPDEGPPVLRMDARTHAWQKASSYIEAVRDASGAAVAGWDTEALPAVKADGTWCLSDPKRSVSCVFPDRSWRRWSPDEIAGATGASVWTSPFLAPDGRIIATINRLGKNTTWALNQGTWQPTEVPPSHTPLPQAPDRCGATTTPVMGEDGRWWLTVKDQLVVARGRLCQPRMTEVSMPLTVSLARFDATHHDLLVVGNEIIVLVDDESFPETRLGAPRIDMDSVALAIKDRPPMAEYRDNLGNWQITRLPNDGTLVIEGLEPGPHRIDVRSADGHLRVDPTPATVRVEVSRSAR